MRSHELWETKADNPDDETRKLLAKFLGEKRGSKVILGFVCLEWEYIGSERDSRFYLEVGWELDCGPKGLQQVSSVDAAAAIVKGGDVSSEIQQYAINVYCKEFGSFSDAMLRSVQKGDHVLLSIAIIAYPRMFDLAEKALKKYGNRDLLASLRACDN